MEIKHHSSFNKKVNEEPVKFLQVFAYVHNKFVNTHHKPTDYDNVEYISSFEEYDYFLCWHKDDPTVKILFRGRLNSGNIE